MLLACLAHSVCFLRYKKHYGVRVIVILGKKKNNIGLHGRDSDTDQRKRADWWQSTQHLFEIRSTKSALAPVCESVKITGVVTLQHCTVRTTAIAFPSITMLPLVTSSASPPPSALFLHYTPSSNICIYSSVIEYSTGATPLRAADWASDKFANSASWLEVNERFLSYIKDYSTCLFLVHQGSPERILLFRGPISGSRPAPYSPLQKKKNKGNHFLYPIPM